MDNYNDIVVEADLVTHIRLDMAPNPAYAHTTAHSISVDSVLNDDVPDLLLVHTKRVKAPLVPKQGPDLISGVVAMDDAMFTTLFSLASGVFATSRFNCHVLLETKSPQPFTHQVAFDLMLSTGAADTFYVRSTTPRSWSGFGSRELLSTHRQA